MTDHPKQAVLACATNDVATPRTTRLGARLDYRALVLAVAIGFGGCDDATPIDSSAADSASADPMGDAALDRSSSGMDSEGGSAIDGGDEASAPVDAGAPSDHAPDDARGSDDTSTGRLDGDSAPYDAVPSDNGPPFDRAPSDSGTSDGDTSPVGDTSSPDDGYTGSDAPPHDSGTSRDAAAPTAGIRLLAPLSTATATSHRPVLRWALESGVEGAHVEICRDRSCTNLVTSLDVTGSSAAPSVELTAGLYFWRAYARRGATTSTIATPVWQFWVGARSAAVNASWGTVSDVDGDGWFDAIIGGDNHGIDVFVAVGRNGTTMHTTLLPNGPSASSIASAGDVNGDGYADLVVGARGVPAQTVEQPTPGGAVVFAGSTTGLSSLATHVLSPLGADLGFGTRVTSAGDVNGDGYADVIIEGDEAVYVYLGGPAGLRRLPAAILHSNTFNFAQEVSSAGDLNGDGYGDVIIGAHRQGAGRVYAYLGSAAGLSSPIFIDGPDGGPAGFGASLGCAGDTNGDGYADFIVGEPSAGGVGHAYVYLGSASGFSATPIVLNSIGSPVTSAGDLNGDGYDDIAIGYTLGRNDAGIVYVFFGSANGPSSTPAVFEGYPTPNFGDGFGTSLVRGGDVDHDGYGDILIGSPTFNLHTGRATILFGSPSMAPPGRRMLIDQARRSRFGALIAGG